MRVANRPSPGYICRSVLCASRSDAHALLVSLNEGQMSIRSQSSHGLPGRSGGFKVGQGCSLYAERAASGAGIFVSP